MRILVTNDDGIDAPGLHALANAMCDLEGGHEIVVAAPDTEYSGAGAALGHELPERFGIAHISGHAASHTDDGEGFARFYFWAITVGLLLGNHIPEWVCIALSVDEIYGGSPR